MDSAKKYTFWENEVVGWVKRHIGYNAFSGCTGLTSITIPDSVTSIGSWAFGGCSGLTSITISNSATSIGNYVFNGCSGLTSITIPNGVTSIGNYAFKGCTGLTSITIPDGVTSVGNYAFSGCTSLTGITIPNGVTSIDASAFNGCTNLKCNVYQNGKYLGNDKNPYLILHDTVSTNLTQFEFAPGVKLIGSSAFSYCANLTSMPDEEIDRINVTYRSTADTSFAVDTVGTSLHVATDGGCDGIRFLTRLYFGSFKATSNTLRVNYNGTRYTVMEFGTLIKRAENETELTVANVEASTATGAKRMWKSVAYTKGDDMKLVDYTDAYVDFSAVMMRGSKVSDATFNARSYTARGYMKLKASNGTEFVIECDSEVTNSINATQALM